MVVSYCLTEITTSTNYDHVLQILSKDERDSDLNLTGLGMCIKATLLNPSIHDHLPHSFPIPHNRPLESEAMSSRLPAVADILGGAMIANWIGIL